MTNTGIRTLLSQDDLLALLSQRGIATTTLSHPPVHTVEEALEHWAALEGIHTKNLFLKDAKGGLWLVSMPISRSLDLKTLPKRIGAKRLSFASGDLLLETLGVQQGAVSPFALLNDAERRVRLVLDAGMLREPRLTFHPLNNTATTSIPTEDLLAFLAAYGIEPLVVDFDTPIADATVA